MNNDNQTTQIFSLQFKDKSIWNEFKDDLKTILRDNDIKFQYSEKTPVFFTLYRSDTIKIRIIWEDDSLLFKLEASLNINSDKLSVCKEIFDLLRLFSGVLVDGSSPYDW